MDDRELNPVIPTDDITPPLPDPTQQNEQGLSENTSAEGLPQPGEAPPQPEQELPQSTPPQPDLPGDDCAEPQMILCPRCANRIPNENFCPVCSLSLRGAPPAQPAPPHIPVYGAMPPVASQPRSGAAYPPAYPPSYAPPYPQQPPAWQAPPQGYPAPPKPPRDASVKWPAVVGIVLGGLILLLQLITLIVIGFGVSRINERSTTEFGGGYFTPDEGYSGEYQLPEHVLPQYFIGDTVVNNDISYDFDYSHVEETDTGDTALVVVGVTFKNNSDTAFTLTPSLFRLEDAFGEPCEYSPKLGNVAAKDVLERTVLMPGEKVSKLLLYSATGGEYDYLPLYVLDQSGSELFYVYLSLYS